MHSLLPGCCALLQRVYYEYHKAPRTLDNTAKRLRAKAQEQLEAVRQRLQAEAEAAAAAAATAASSAAPAAQPAAAAAGQQGVQLPEVLFDEPPSQARAPAEASAPVQEAAPPASSTSPQQQAAPAVTSQQQQAEQSQQAGVGTLPPQQQFAALKEQGKAHFAAKDFQAAEACWQQCLEADADNAAVLANLCFLYLRMAEQLPEGSVEQRARAQACVRAGKQVLAQPAVIPDTRTKALYR